MISLLHISDIHFTTISNPQYDLDNEIRKGIISDLTIRNGGGFDAILVSGDIAYNGKADEYIIAREWIKELQNCISVDDTSVYVIPGNHDVNRLHTKKHSTAYDAHQKIRSSPDAIGRNEVLTAKLKDESCNFLQPLADFSLFAQTFACNTDTNNLTWEAYLNKSLSNGTRVRIVGMNSAILSDELDGKGNMLVGPYQTKGLKIPRDCVEIIMCHHPSTWLIDEPEISDRFRNCANLVLTGHEHTSRCYQFGQALCVCAGAVHPSRSEAEWLPTYNIINLDIEDSSKSELVISVESRAWDKRHFQFTAMNHFGKTIYEYRQNSPQIKPARDFGKSQAAPTKVENDKLTETSVKSIEISKKQAKRELVIEFFKLGLIDRYTAVHEVGLLEEDDDKYEGQLRWARIFRRAEDNGLLDALHSKVKSINSERK